MNEKFIIGIDVSKTNDVTSICCIKKSIHKRTVVSLVSFSSKRTFFTKIRIWLHLKYLKLRYNAKDIPVY